MRDLFFSTSEHSRPCESFTQRPRHVSFPSAHSLYKSATILFSFLSTSTLPSNPYNLTLLKSAIINQSTFRLVQPTHFTMAVFCTSRFAPYSFFIDSENSFKSRNATTPTSESRAPAYSQQTTDTETFLQVDLPGVEKHNVSVEVEGNKLTVTGKRYRPTYSASEDVQATEPQSPTKKAKTDHNDEVEPTSEETVKQNDKPAVVYKRTFVLARNVDTEAVRAHNFNNGVLSLVLPAKKESLPRKIQIQ